MQRKHKNKIDYNTMFFYREFMKEHRSLELSQRDYTNILKTFFTLIVTNIVEESFRFLFPRIGLFYLIRRKQKIVKGKDGKPRMDGAINWPETKALRKKTESKTRKVYYLNDHSNRWIYSLMWDRGGKDFTNKKYYKFIINKKHRQYMHKIIMSGKLLNAFKLWYQ